MKHLAALPASFFLTLFLAACSSSGGDECLVHTDCPAGEQCQDGRCVLPSDGGQDGNTDDGNTDDGGSDGGDQLADQDDGGNDGGDDSADQDDGGSDGGQDGGGDQIIDPACAALHEGRNTGFTVDGLDREFILGLPNGVENGGPWPVIFNYHGLGDTASNMNQLLAGQVNDADFPFILVTPEDTDHALSYMGQTIVFDWDVFQADEQNKEVRFFDELIECLDQKWGVNRSHIHAVGFSMGGLLTDMMATLRGEDLASVATYSGGYWANPNNRNMYINMFASYPEYDVSNHYTQLFIHGGTTDTFNASVFVIHFDEYAASDLTMLNDAGHDAIVCNHNSGHTIPSQLLGPQLIDFFAAHPLGATDSPWGQAGLPGNFPSYCSFEAKSP